MGWPGPARVDRRCGSQAIEWHFDLKHSYAHEDDLFGGLTADYAAGSMKAFYRDPVAGLQRGQLLGS